MIQLAWADLFEKEKMRPKGRGKYCYKPKIYGDANELYTSLYSAYIQKFLRHAAVLRFGYD